MAIKQVYHIEIDEETDVSQRFYYTDDSTGLPIDLTGYRAEMQVRPSYGGTEQPQTLLKFTSDPNGGIVLGGPAGTVDLYISYEDTSSLLWNEGSYDVFIIAPTGKRSKFLKGFFTMVRSSTRLSESGLTDISSTKTPPYDQPNNYNVGGTNKGN